MRRCSFILEPVLPFRSSTLTEGPAIAKTDPFKQHIAWSAIMNNQHARKSSPKSLSKDQKRHKEQIHCLAERETTELVSALCNANTTRSIAVQTKLPAENTYRGASAAWDVFTPPLSGLRKRRARRAPEPSSTPFTFKVFPPRKGILRSPHAPHSDKSVHFSPKDYSTLFRKDQVLDMELFEKRKELGLDLGPDPSVRPIGRTKATIRRGGWAEGRRLHRKMEEEGELDDKEVWP